jgi:hypothetical protein
MENYGECKWCGNSFDRGPYGKVYCSERCKLEKKQSKQQGQSQNYDTDGGEGIGCAERVKFYVVVLVLAAIAIMIGKCNN